tara:strand:- start:64 stop:354 length:291 start_codon:yes stop_codon:yes gene_type:complete
MKYPSKAKLEPLGFRFAEDANYKVCTNGKVTNRKKGLNNTTWKSVYHLALSLYKGKMIKKVRVKGKVNYEFKEIFGLMPYPYIRGVDKTHKLKQEG